MILLEEIGGLNICHCRESPTKSYYAYSVLTLNADYPVCRESDLGGDAQEMISNLLMISGVIWMTFITIKINHDGNEHWDHQFYQHI